MNKIGKLMQAMTKYYAGDIKRINHFMKVYSYAKAIGEVENLDDNTMAILETTAVVHDIGIKISEEKYQSSAGHYQQIEGPAIAEAMLSELGYEKEFIDRVSYLIAHHHTYHDIIGSDYQILVEADFLVNLQEDNVSTQGIKKVKENIFKTGTGIQLLKDCFGV
jgi:HD superfamily phosphodiesterase